MTRHGDKDSHGAKRPADGDTRTIELLRKIESGSMDPKAISAAERRQLVAFLMGDGYSTAETAQILGVNDRTIERDKKTIRESNAIARDPKLVGQMVGRLYGEAELSIQRIRKAVRDKKVSPAVKIEAEHRCYQIVSDLTQSLQRLGYLPTAARKVEADLTHHVAELPDLNSIQAEIRRIKAVCRDTKAELPPQVALLEEQAARAELATGVEQLAAEVGDPKEGQEDDE
jgi:transposase-like protein